MSWKSAIWPRNGKLLRTIANVHLCRFLACGDQFEQHETHLPSCCWLLACPADLRRRGQASVSAGFSKLRTLRHSFALLIFQEAQP